MFQAVDLSENKLGTLGAKVLGEMLHINVNLKEVYLKGNNFTDKDIEYFAEVTHGRKRERERGRYICIQKKIYKLSLLNMFHMESVLVKYIEPRGF